MSKHQQVPGKKVPSRRGGLRTVRCTCGWQSGPELAEFRDATFAAHVKAEEAWA